jgi:hypothetical protein
MAGMMVEETTPAMEEMAAEAEAAATVMIVASPRQPGPAQAQVLVFLRLQTLGAAATLRAELVLAKLLAAAAVMEVGGMVVAVARKVAMAAQDSHWFQQ